MLFAEAARWEGAVGSIGAALVTGLFILVGVWLQTRKTRRRNTEEHDRNKQASAESLGEIAGKVDGVAGQLVDVAGAVGAVGVHVHEIDQRLTDHIDNHPHTPITPEGE